VKPSLLPQCPENLPPDISLLLKQIGEAWATSPQRPRLDKEIVSKWSSLLETWIASQDLPLLIRKSSESRGTEILHCSGRSLIPTDNSPAQWVFSLALKEECPSIEEIRGLYKADQIPIAMALKKVEKERAKYKCPLTACVNLNRLGWKLAHIRPIGLKHHKPLAETPLEDILTHFHYFLSPSNLFVVPLSIGGLGELDQVTRAIAANNT
jgi:hypothetical protein